MPPDRSLRSVRPRELKPLQRYPEMPTAPAVGAFPQHEQEEDVAREVRLRAAVDVGHAILEKLAVDHAAWARTYAARAQMDALDSLMAMLDEPRTGAARHYAQQIIYRHIEAFYEDVALLLQTVSDKTRQLVEKELYPPQPPTVTPVHPAPEPEKWWKKIW